VSRVHELAGLVKGFVRRWQSGGDREAVEAVRRCRQEVPDWEGYGGRRLAARDQDPAPSMPGVRADGDGPCFWQVVESSFISELKARPAGSLEELNTLLAAWLEQGYQHWVNRETGETPAARFVRGLADLRRPDPVRLGKLSLWQEERKVDKTTQLCGGTATGSTPGWPAGRCGSATTPSTSAPSRSGPTARGSTPARSSSCAGQKTGHPGPLGGPLQPPEGAPHRHRRGPPPLTDHARRSDSSPTSTWTRLHRWPCTWSASPNSARHRLRLKSLEAISQRVNLRFHLVGLPEKETRAYIEHHLKVAGVNHTLFSDEAVRLSMPTPVSPRRSTSANSA